MKNLLRCAVLGALCLTQPGLTQENPWVNNAPIQKPK